MRALKAWARKHRIVISLAVILCIAGAMAYANYMQNRRFSVDPATYRPLLQLIAKAESNDNYNAYFGNAANSAVDFTSMTIADVQRWQADYIRQGSASSAVGRYQIINTTLAGLVQRLGLSPDTKFDRSTQDQLAIALIERRGAESYANQELTPEQFAHNLAKEWAGLPKVIGDKPGDSYYAGDGLNKARVDTGEVLQAIQSLDVK